MSKLEKIGARRPWGRDVALRGSTPRRKSGNSDDARQRLLDGFTIFYALDDVIGIVRDAGEPPRIVFDRAHEIQVRAAHVLHRADRRGDVDRILRLVEDNSYRGQNGPRPGH